MLAGCSSSTLLSPRHRLRSEAPAQFQACHFQLPSSMSTQRLDLPSCTTATFTRNNKDHHHHQPLRPVGLSVDQKHIEAKTSTCSLKQHIRLPPLAITASATPLVEESSIINDNNNKSLKKRLAAEHHDDSFAKRKKSSSTTECDWFQPDVVETTTLGGFNNNNTSLVSFSSEEQERVCFLPSEVVSHSAPFPLNPWLESCVTKITNFGEGSHRHPHHHHHPHHHNDHASGSVSNASSESQSLRLNDNVSEHEVGNGSGNPYYHHRKVEAGEEDDHHGFELVSLLTGCVDAIGSRNVTAINHFIAKLGDLASPKGTTSISRICAYFTEALAIRVTRLWPHVFHIAAATTSRDMVEDDESATALRLLNQVTPIPKFLHFTSNEMLLRAFEGKDRVHIIDFDIKQGLQWPSLFQSLASRSNPPIHVRITGIGESKQDLNETGERLAGFAEVLNLPFEFHPVVDRLEDVRLWMLHVKEHETVAVNCVSQLHKTLHDGSGGALRDFLGLIRSTKPSVVVVAEQEAEHNHTRLEARVCNSLKYYSALFDSIEESGLPIESAVRVKIEEMYGKEIRNIIACEGRERVERHESFGNWRRMMVEQGGFRCMSVTERELSQSQMLLKMYSCESYSVKKQEKEGATGVTLSWLEQPLYTVSAWGPVDAAAGTSSSFSHPS
ncbi:hypothetical protein AAZX31_17G127100 [Glycine max]|uniref:Uncharacterized protein n=2 Tax=Glycine subgen. Soja TaxID=1462606 RepID=I1MUR1_SOYBN|nr:scarecrow-like protein 28 [Glycine max]XP_006600806.1 scarecrow-like protein 28 [Glycine max]XP_006600807.1 scarecrow-like protein 28 [Glycine max]XP_028211243.1 scarecrow-like protein 28 [Glycine soja]XP_028211244.1 scarecrow-like protein 28 [Glycine soja]XP_028211245.1 scarecrow-like protein 28 [Glycine soja]KAG4378930.1 hypothetical protein GLYMA_17G131200v4 [Glycine max]KAG4378931.1 hypothetical protein GLYMA_17G131200v4 [Glycine max]KAG4930319.1 hypothetical protein JHK86_047280 [Gl|eukprot:XP_003549861.1 scarecrow-like protein 28 [Glycine max]